MNSIVYPRQNFCFLRSPVQIPCGDRYTVLSRSSVPSLVFITDPELLFELSPKPIGYLSSIRGTIRCCLNSIFSTYNFMWTRPRWFSWILPSIYFQDQQPSFGSTGNRWWQSRVHRKNYRSTPPSFSKNTLRNLV